MKRYKYLSIHLIFFVLAVIVIALQKFNDKVYFLFQKPSIWLYQTKNNKADAQKMINAKVLLLEQENFKLKKELLILKKYKDIYTELNKNFDIISIANIVVLDYNYKNFIIAKTYKQVNLNDIVVDRFGFLVGRVVKTDNDKIIKIQLLNNLLSYIPVKTIKGNVYGAIYGNPNDKECSIVLTDYIGDNINDNIKDGTQIITSGEYNLIPQGINVGIIKTKNDKYCVEQQAELNFDILIVVRSKTIV